MNADHQPVACTADVAAVVSLKRHAQAVARVRKAAQPFSWAALERDRLDRQIAQLTAKRERL